jgi:hypothetical protein
MILTLKVLLISSCLALYGCVVAPSPHDLVAKASERARGVSPASEWNSYGIWCQIDGDPATYLPVGYSEKQPRTEKEGLWVVDTRSPGKRLFVPHVGVNGYSAGVLRGEATKVCDWEHDEISWWLVPPHQDMDLIPLN